MMKNEFSPKLNCFHCDSENLLAQVVKKLSNGWFREISSLCYARLCVILFVMHQYQPLTCVLDT